jgi:hypothetical protein
MMDREREDGSELTVLARGQFAYKRLPKTL